MAEQHENWANKAVASRVAIVCRGMCGKGPESWAEENDWNTAETGCITGRRRLASVVYIYNFTSVITKPYFVTSWDADQSWGEIRKTIAWWHAASDVNVRKGGSEDCVFVGVIFPSSEDSRMICLRGWGSEVIEGWY